jgi:ATP-binding cassette subfamily B protein
MAPRVILIGPMGSGKTTILNLLMRQLEVNSGEILIDQKIVKSINLDDFRNQTGIVPQDVFLFSDSIENNILFGSNDPKIGHKEVVESAKKAHVYNNIIAFPDQFETILGERGVNLSGGQKQRISIARALIRNPKLLVLDDCLSAVDTETEDIILSHLKEEFKNRMATSFRSSCNTRSYR